MIDIPKGPRMIIELLEKNGKEAYVVGGCVRDSLLCKTPTDWDITTSGTPSEMMEIFKHFTIIPTGIEHGTMTILIDKEPFEVTTFRVDGEYLDGRRPETVDFAKDLREDMRRRDFTINAMAYHPEKGLFDYFNGQEDLAHQIIRAVGETEKRFSEDYLRMIRAYRFAATLNFTLVDEIKASVAKHKDKIKDLGAERLQIEIIKTFTDGVPEKTGEFIEVFEVFLFPSFHRLPKNKKEKALSYFFAGETLGEKLAFLYLFVSSQKTYEDLMKLKFSNDILQEVMFFLAWKDAEKPTNKIELKKILARTGEDKGVKLFRWWRQKESVMKNSIDDFDRIDCWLEEIREAKEPFRLKDLAISGHDILKATGKKQGPWLGQILDYLLQIVIEQENDNQKDRLLLYARDWIYERENNL